jgi:replication initiation protein RepC
MQMQYVPVTAFRRPITAVQIERHREAGTPSLPEVSKWDALRALATARRDYALSDRDLTVLQALIGFHPETLLGGDGPPPVVYPSNKAICARLNGMPCSTMRRHVAKLVETGVILRRDSPNGKRYVRRAGGAPLAFGFDLSPLVTRFEEFRRAARRIEKVQARVSRLREVASLMRRDLAALVDFGQVALPGLPLWDRLDDLARLAARDLRRKLDEASLSALCGQLEEAIAEASGSIEPETGETGTNDARNEHHHQRSDKDFCDGKPVDEEEALREEAPSLAAANPPLAMVLQACEEIQVYADRPIRHWHDLGRTADVVAPMLGIKRPAWEEARRQMTDEQLATVIAVMLQRFGQIRHPAAYLRSLGARAESGTLALGQLLRSVGAAQSSQL